MNDTITCNECGQMFCVDKRYFSIIEKGDYKVQYFTCPYCGKRFQILTIDSKMRKLINRRNVVQSLIRIGRAKKFNTQILSKYEQELKQIKRKQEKMLLPLKAIGERILHEESGQDVL